jgi:ArsR family transcriptional regulator, arsenate/arsenite/antimonite-responsive transcriptional repressor
VISKGWYKLAFFRYALKNKPLTIIAKRCIMSIYPYEYIDIRGSEFKTREEDNGMDRLTDFFKMVSDETRLRLLALLYHKKLCVCQLCGILNESQPKVSKHLAKMRDMGFVKDERQEQFIYYSLNFDNELYKNVLKNITDNLEQYPVIKGDIEKIGTAEKFLESCKNTL